MKRKEQDFSEHDYAFMQSLSEAMLVQTPKKWRLVLYIWLITFLIFILWAYIAEVDEITRGQGEIVASGDNKIIQNLEGGVVEEILVKEGDVVNQGQILLKISNERSQANFEADQIKRVTLEAKVARLQAEIEGRPFEVSSYLQNGYPALAQREKEVFESNQVRYQSDIAVLESQLLQKKSNLSENKGRLKDLRYSLSLINEEISISRPMAEKGVYSKIDFLKLQRERSTINEKLNGLKSATNGLAAAVSEAEDRIRSAQHQYRTESLEQLNEAMSELDAHNANAGAAIDQVKRTIVRSPIIGVVQKVYVNTIGGAIRPAETLVEIVPSDAPLEVNVKILPSDIAFIYPGQKAIVKVSAYDFSLYGGLEGEVSHISADTVTDEQQNTYFMVSIRTQKNYLGREEKPLYIAPGMTVDVDVLTGKKSILDYILKPIVKSSYYTFSER